jgi:SnoaL-like domain
VAESPISQLLSALDRLDVDGAMALFAPDARILMADGRRAEGAQGIRALLEGFVEAIRQTSHEVTAEWHPDGVWIAEVSASYHLKDRLRTGALPRIFVIRAGKRGIDDARVYGAHEHPLDEHHGGEEGMWLGGRWIPPL